MSLTRKVSMSKHKKNRIVRTNLQQHPATQAWRQLHYGRAVPERIEILKRRPRNRQKDFKRIVCRLVAVLPDGGAVIAKRCKMFNANVEHIIYEQILPNLPVSSLKYYGMVKEANERFCWLLLEDVGDELEPSQLAEYRLLIAYWLAQLHSSSEELAAAAGLPHKGPDYFLQRLVSARNDILGHISNHSAQDDHLVTLETIVRHFDLLESHWDQVEAMCGRVPWTLVHGDFAVRNFGVRADQEAAAVLPFDWAEGAWGTPAIDMREVDVNAYLSVVKSRWPWLDGQKLQKMALAGRIFRSIDSIYWELGKLNYAWLSFPMDNMKRYEIPFSNAINVAGIGK